MGFLNSSHLGQSILKIVTPYFKGLAFSVGLEWDSVERIKMETLLKNSYKNKTVH